MSDSWNDRKKSLEEDYFHRKEREAIEKARAQREAERLEREAAGKTLQCPKCDGTLEEITYEEIEIDRCVKCSGVWFDAGELELLTNREEQEGKGWLARIWRKSPGQ